MRTVTVAAAVASIALSAPAVAADWKLAGLSIGERNRGVTYVDVDSVREQDGKIRFRSEQYLERPFNQVTRIAATSEVDCATMTVSVVRQAYYAGQSFVGLGKASPREANHYSANSSYHWVLRRICEGDYLSASIDDRGSDAVRIFAQDWTPVPGRLSLLIPSERTNQRMAGVGGLASAK